MTYSNNKFTILLIDDEPLFLSSLKRFYARSDYLLLLADNGEKGLEMLAANRIDLLLLDLKMPGIDGLEVLERAIKCVPGLKVIIQTGHGGLQEAVQAIRKGALDFLVKGDVLEILNNRIRLVYEKWLLERQYKELRERLTDSFQFDQLMGHSPAIEQLKNFIVRVAPTETTVLIQGESGTGKELIAQALHYHSEKRNKPFVAVDCASISESVFESELFGHEKGAFTSADSSTLGLIRSADTGTLFLDEIGEISTSVQAKLLRVIQERTVRPVGSTQSYPVDVRIISATNKNLLDEVARATFRQDLYYRISTVSLTAPPLRERGDDIALLTNHILEQCSTAMRRSISVASEVSDLLERYEWPGNVRELENVLRGAAVFVTDGIIRPEDLPPALQTIPSVQGEIEKIHTLAAYERKAIKNALVLTKNNRKKAFELLEISEATLYRKIKQYQL
ncbi:MAG: sigma-54-dependent Fis family transcriptional regulator [Desulfobulbaceae bacterium]|jgi:DNA-binding NtrC family response regulator|nr:sigma-54-dependent Fis family transcriptional regulator [Desulfobulbaceae bacterium]